MEEEKDEVEEVEEEEDGVEEEGGERQKLSPIRRSPPSPSHLVPEDGVGLVAAHRQGVALQPQVHGRIVVPDVGHVLQRSKVSRRVRGGPVEGAFRASTNNTFCFFLFFPTKTRTKVTSVPPFTC